MKSTEQEDSKIKRQEEINTYTIPFSEKEIQEIFPIKKNNSTQISKGEIISKALSFQSKGNIIKAAQYYQEFLDQGFHDPRVYSNYGTILIDSGNIREAEVLIRKAIAINPNSFEAHYNLGNTLKIVGKLKEAEISILKAIELNPNFTPAYFVLSTLKKFSQKKTWQNNLFSTTILNNKLDNEKVNIYFARANILHNEKKYKESSHWLQLANCTKQKIKPFKKDILINKSKALLLESEKKSINYKEIVDAPESIFIVGMLRSGSTLLESIISMNPEVDDLGEFNILEQSFLELKHLKKEVTLSELYWNKVKCLKEKFTITTNKWLQNYQYSGIIASQIQNAKIIHCYRNPLDNILSIYRAHFTSGNEYSSSLVESAKIYLDQEELMNKYKKRFRSKIFDLNYDLLVTHPNTQIRSLISWLGWEWNDQYLSPHLNTRSISTASSVQVRSPINSKSIGGWKNYEEMLQPAIEIINKKNTYRDQNN